MPSAPAKDRRQREIEIAAALVLLNTRAQRGIRASVTAIGLPLLARLPIYESSLVVANVTSRALFASRTAARASALKLSLLPREIVVASPLTAQADIQAARAAGTSLGNQWAPLYEAAENDAEKAVRALRWRLDRSAATETAAAWNQETKRLGDRAHDAGMTVTDTWCALADACPACADLDGETRTRPDTFTDDPPLHGHCWCFLSTDYAERLAA